jgi:hypothetical protein
MTPKSARKNKTGAIGWPLDRSADLGLLPSLASLILGILLLSGAIWLGLHAQEMEVGPRGLLGLFLAGGSSLIIGLKGLSQKRRHPR